MFSVADCTSIINQLLPEPHAGLLSGIVFGVKANLDPALTQALITTGTLHIVALSGMNITILTTMVNKSLLWLIPKTRAGLISIILIVGFILFVGPSPSVVRAGIMGAISSVGLYAGKPVLGLWSWGLAVVAMLIMKPAWITELSFQLSVLASLGMILFGKAQTPVFACNRTFIEKIKETITGDLHTTLAAQTLTIPLLFVTFGRLSLISPLTNVLIVWTLPALTVLGFLVVTGGLIFFPVGQIFAWVAWIFLEYLIRVIMLTSALPFASWQW